MIKNFVYLLLLIISITLGVFIGKSIFGSKSISQKNQTIVLESIKGVFKLITVEGNFSDIYDHKEYWLYDYSPFSKKMIVKVNANAKVGFDFSNIDIIIDNKAHTVRVDKMPTVEMIVLDYDLEYYDITEGIFNSFTEKDFSSVDDTIKKQLKTKAMNLLSEKAISRKDSLLSDLESILNLYEWKLIIEENHFNSSDL